jgi:S1-C subfamily serine protease
MSNFAQIVCIVVFGCSFLGRIPPQSQASPQNAAQVPSSNPTKEEDFDTLLMEATFKIEGVGVGGQVVTGTGFLMGRPYPKDATKGRFVLITASHVLEDIKSDVITVFSRKAATGGHWIKVPFQVTIRADGRPNYMKLPEADIAVMYIHLPVGVIPPLISTDNLADDELLKKFEVHPGDEVRCLGYPLGLEANDAGFPVLRSGKIASYPLVPTDYYKTFLFDFKVFKGNSGGPVYLSDRNRFYGGSLRLGETVHFIIGLVSEEELFSQRIPGVYSDEVRQLQLDLGIVVHASLIRKAIELLPAPDTVPD